VYNIFAGKPGGKKPLRIHRRRLEDNIKMNLVKIEWNGVD
jgi:hypothetical protein